MGKNVVGWFEIPVTDIERAKRFYNAAFGIHFTDMEMPHGRMSMFGDENGEGDMHAYGIVGCLVQAKDYVPSQTGSIVYFLCEEVGATLQKIEEAGGQVLVPKMSIGEHGFIGHFTDSEGNRVAVHSMQ